MNEQESQHLKRQAGDCGVERCHRLSAEPEHVHGQENTAKDKLASRRGDFEFSRQLAEVVLFPAALQPGAWRRVAGSCETKRGHVATRKLNCF